MAQGRLRQAEGGDELWQAPREETRRGQRARTALFEGRTLPKGVSRRAMAQFRPHPRSRRAVAASPPFATGETLSERDLIRGSLARPIHE